MIGEVIYYSTGLNMKLTWNAYARHTWLKRTNDSALSTPSEMYLEVFILLTALSNTHTILSMGWIVRVILQESSIPSCLLRHFITTACRP